MLQGLDITRWEIWVPLAVVLLLGALWAVLAARRRAERARNLEFDAYREAFVALLRDDLEASSEALRRAAKQNSSRIETYLVLGGIIRRLGDPQRALRVHRSLLVRTEITPSHRFEALREAALDELASGRPREALALVDEVLAKRRKDREALAAAVEAHARLGHWEAAYENQRRLDRVTGADHPALLARLMSARGRQLLISEKDPGAARKAFKKAIGAHARSVEALLGLGDAALLDGKAEQAHFALGDVDRLEGILRKLAGERPEDANLHFLLGRHLAKKQRVDEALGSLKQALDLDPGNLAAHRERCWLRLEHGPEAGIDADLRALLDALPVQPPAAVPPGGTSRALEEMLGADERRAWESTPAPPPAGGKR